MPIDKGTRVQHRRNGQGTVQKWLPGRPELRGFEFDSVYVEWDKKLPHTGRITSWVYEKDVEVK